MTFDDNTTKIIIALIGLILIGGSITFFNYSKNKSIKKTIKVNQKKIKIKGDGDVVGGNKNVINGK